MIPGKPSERQPKGDHNRRLSLGIDLDDFAYRAGLTPEQVREYEMTSPDHDFDPDVAQRYGEALERLEANPPASQSVEN
jgi:cytochrome oxidase assembly protein ShyY1